MVLNDPDTLLDDGKESDVGAQEKAQLLRALTVLVEDQHSVLALMLDSSQPLQTSVQCQ